jgi:hypothetical protein
MERKKGEPATILELGRHCIGLLTKQHADAVSLVTDSFFVMLHVFVTAPNQLKFTANFSSAVSTRKFRHVGEVARNLLTARRRQTAKMNVPLFIGVNTCAGRKRSCVVLDVA